MSAPWEKYQSQASGPWTKYTNSTSSTDKDSSIGDIATEAAKSTVMGPLNATKYMLQNPEKLSGQLPVAGAIVGSVIAPGPGTALGAGLGQIGSRMADLAYGRVNPADATDPLKESIGPMVQTALSGFPETQAVKGWVQSAAQSLGRRALGFNKGMIKRTPGGIDRLNQDAQTMLDQGVIAPLRSAADMADKATELSLKSGRAIGDTLKKVGAPALDTNAVSSEVINQLAPEFQGGAYAGKEKIADEIIDTISAHGDGPISFENAQKLKETLAETAGNNWVSDKAKAKMYRRAYGIVNKAMEDGLDAAASASPDLPVVKPGSRVGEPHALFAYNDNLSPDGTKRAIYNVYGDPSHPAIQARGFGSSVPKSDLDAAGIPIVGREPRAVGVEPAGNTPGLPKDVLTDYIANKKIYGSAQKALEGLNDRAAAEASNSLLSLRGAAVGAGALASGHITPALEAMGAWEAARRLGTGTGAATLNFLNNAPLAENIRRAVMSKFIDRFVMGKKNQ